MNSPDPLESEWEWERPAAEGELGWTDAEWNDWFADQLLGWIESRWSAPVAAEPDALEQINRDDDVVLELEQDLPTLEWIEGRDELAVELYGEAESIRQKFLKTLADINLGKYLEARGWSVHHLYPQAMLGNQVAGSMITKAWLDDTSRLILIPPHIKSEIDQVYFIWAKEEAKAMGINTNQRGWQGIFWKRVDPEKVKVLVDAVRETFRDRYIVANLDVAEANRILSLVDGRNKLHADTLRAASRLEGVLKKTGKWTAGLGFLLLFASAGETVAAVVRDGPEVRGAWSAFEVNYRGCLRQALESGHMSRSSAQALVTSFDLYLRAIRIDDQARQLIVFGLQRYVDDL